METQVKKALQKANDIRLGRAQIKREIKAGEVSIIDVIETCPYVMQSIRMLELLCSQSRWGVTRSRRLLAGLGVPESKTLGSLTDRQRRLACSLLGGENG